MIRASLHTFIPLLLALVFAGCYTSSSNYRFDYSYIYDADQKLIKPNFKVFHHHQDSSTVYFQLLTNDLLYGRKEGDTILSARMLVKYKLYSDFSKKEITDSATYPIYTEGVNSSKQLIQGKIKIKSGTGKVYPLEIRFRDQNKNLNVVNDIVLDKRMNSNQQYFLLKSGERVIIDQVIRQKGEVKLYKSPLLSSSNFLWERTNLMFSMTPPPFTVGSTQLPEIPIDFTDTISLLDKALDLKNYYQINRIASNSEQAYPFYFYYFYDGYPQLTKHVNMVDPIRYISTNSEYKNVKNSINTKQAIDDFWLNLLKDEDKAKKALKTYYNRVEQANQFFTDYREGWKTDRGIIYIVFGQPSTIYKNTENETWIYGDEGNILSLSFKFVKNNHPISVNNYTLIRNSDYKSSWYRAVDLWRQGKIQ